MARLKYLIFLLVYLFLILLVGIICSVAIYEMISGRWSRAETSWHDTNTRFDPELGWSPIPGKHLNFWGGVTTNSYGFRSGELEDGKKKIIIIGDSTAWGYGVADQEAIPGILEKKARPLGYQVSNLAVSGYSVDQEYLMLKRHIAKFKDLKYVILIICAENDLNEVKGNVIYGKRKPLYVIDNGALQLKNVPISIYDLRNLISRSQLLTNLSRKYKNFNKALNRLTHERNTSDEESKKVVSLLLKNIQKLTAAQGAALTVVIVPSKYDFPKKTKSLMWLEDFFKNSTYRYFDLYPIFSEHSEDLGHLYKDPVHFSKHGNRLVAEAIFRYMDL